MTTPSSVSTSTSTMQQPSKAAVPAAWLALIATAVSLVLLASLHVLSPEFAPSWRMISEYALGRYPRVLSLMFLSMGIGNWALALALRSNVCGMAARVGLALMVIAGLGGAMASIYDVNHPVGHGIAGLLGVLGFPVAALLLTRSFRSQRRWQPVAKALTWLAHLSWISVLLLIGTLALMTMQVAKAYGGHLPDHAPKALPPGVLPLDGWADRLIVVTNCAWVLVAAWHAIRLRRKPI